MSRRRLVFPLLLRILLTVWVAILLTVVVGLVVTRQVADPALVPLVQLSLGLVFISLACWWAVRPISRSIRDVTRSAREIASGDKAIRVPEPIANRHDELGDLAGAFNTMTDELLGLLDRQKHLLRDVSHDLRTPLTRQRLAIELGMAGAADAGLMESILRQNERMQVMTDQVLTLCRLSDMGADIAREPVALVGVVHSVLQEAADYAEHRKVDCRLKVSPQCRNITVLGDAGLLQRALDNVLQNALDHTPPGLPVTLQVREEDGKLVCSIADSGPGVPEEALPRLFDPFFRVEAAQGERGWGLGLAIARDIILAHDGEVHAISGEQGG